MRYRIALTREPGAAFARECALAFVERQPIDLAGARRQHRDYRAALTDAGAAVEGLLEQPELPDAAFVEDAAVVLDEVAIIARPALAARRAETATVAGALADHRLLAHVEAPATLEGGDVLVVRRRIFVGLSTRTNREGYDQLAAIGGRHGYRVDAIAVRSCLHLKTVVTALDDETVVINPRWIDSTVFADYRRIETPEDEPFAANTLSVGGVVHLSNRWPRTAALIQSAGFHTRALDISEFEKAEGGVTCLSLIV